MDVDPVRLAGDVGSVGADLLVRIREALPDTLIEAAVAGAAGELLRQLATYRLHEHVAALGQRMSG